MLKLEKVKTRYEQNYQKKFVITKAMISDIVDRCIDNSLSARNIDQIIEREILPDLVDKAIAAN